MANFSKAFSVTMANEGGYVNDPQDTGGETYKGIARKYHPDWVGWEAIDKLKTAGNEADWEAQIDDDEQIQANIETFYKTFYWDRFWGDKIESQEIAEKLFDIAVNMGVYRSVSFLQQIINLLNRNEKLFDDITEDGLFGPISLQTLQKCTEEKGGAGHVLQLLSILQGAYYVESAQKRKTNKRFLRGWLNRLAGEV